MYDYDKERIIRKINEEYPIDYPEPAIQKPYVHRIHFLKTAWFRYAAAILIVIGLGAWFFMRKQTADIAVAPKKQYRSNSIGN